MLRTKGRPLAKSASRSSEWKARSCPRLLVPQVEVCDGLEGVDVAHLQGRTPGCEVVLQLSRAEEGSEAQQRPPATGPRVELARICFPCTSPARQPLDLSRSHCPASLRQIWEVRQRRWGRSSCFLRLSIAANSPRTPWCGIFLGPSKSGKTVADQHDSGAIPQSSRKSIFSPSINIHDGWIPVKKYIEEDLGVNTERERAYCDEWDEAALRDIIQRQRKITETSKKLGARNPRDGFPPPAR